MRAQMLMHVIAHRGEQTLEESALKDDSGRKIPYCTRESNLHQQHAGPTFYHLGYIPAPWALMGKTQVIQLQVKVKFTVHVSNFCKTSPFV